MLQIKGLTIEFANIGNKRPAVQIPDFRIEKGEFVALLGESGSGKTLLSLALMGLLPDNAVIGRESRIFFHDVDLTELPEIKLRDIRGKQTGMIFQEPMTSLNPVMTAGHQVAEALKRHKVCPGFLIQEKVIELFTQVELKNPVSIYNSYPHQLSGGMKQRVMIAMALASEPDLLIADEPTSALDVSVQFEILQLLKKLQKQRGLTVLFITHDVSIVKQVADRVAIMYAGCIIETATTGDFFKNPRHPYSMALMRSVPGSQARGEYLRNIEGVVPSLSEYIPGCVFYSRCQFRKEECLLRQPDLLKHDQTRVACILYAEGAQPKSVNGNQPRVQCNKNTAGDAQAVLQLQDVRVYFPIKKGILQRTVDFVKAVDGVSLVLTRGKTTAIVGESGCGKTTLAKSILGLIPHTSGEIVFSGVNVRKKKLFRKYAQIVFQDPFSSLNPRMLVYDIIAEGMRALKLGDTDSQRIKVEKLVQEMGLAADCVDRYPHEFSGGQRQRICIARALAVEPQLIICDEPTSALDVSIQAQILNLLQKLQADHQLTYLFISHNIAVVAYLADEIIVMKDGKIAEAGKTEDILGNPQHDYTKKLIRASEGLDMALFR